MTRTNAGKALVRRDPTLAAVVAEMPAGWLLTVQGGDGVSWMAHAGPYRKPGITVTAPTLDGALRQLMGSLAALRREPAEVAR